MPGMVLSMFVLRHQLKIAKAVVSSIAVQMVNVTALWNRPVAVLPNVSVQKGTLAVGAPVVASVSQGIAVTAEDDIGEWGRPRLESEFAELKHLVDALPGDAEYLGDCRQAVPVLIQLVHGLRLVVLSDVEPWAEPWTHTLIIDSGVTGVNLCH